MDEAETTTCCIVGGGPAGLMLGLLLSRAGVACTVLEKHEDFLRDFRGDTIHPSTLELIDELGLLDELERVPHQVVSRLRGDVNGQKLVVADFSTLRGPHRCLYMMPQWDFLQLLARDAQKSPTFTLRMSAEVMEPWLEGGRVVGVMYREGRATKRLRADLTVACDGRQSVLRDRLGASYRPIDLGAPMDVLWFRVPRDEDDPDESFGIIRPGRMLVLIGRGDYWQVGYLIPKGDFEHVRAQGIEAFHATLAGLAPFFGDGRLSGLVWRDVHMLRVQVNHMKRWFGPGLLFIGDAAHAMSPIGGVGINLAIQDAVATANLLAGPLRRRDLRRVDLAKVQARRWLPTVVTQLIQLGIQRRVIRRVLGGESLRPPAWMKRLLSRTSVRRLVARTIGLGVLPEHWQPTA